MWQEEKKQRACHFQFDAPNQSKNIVNLVNLMSNCNNKYSIKIPYSDHKKILNLKIDYDKRKKHDLKPFYHMMYRLIFMRVNINFCLFSDGTQIQIFC